MIKVVVFFVMLILIINDLNKSKSYIGDNINF